MLDYKGGLMEGEALDAEMARGGPGVDVHLDRVPLREPDESWLRPAMEALAEAVRRGDAWHASLQRIDVGNGSFIGFDDDRQTLLGRVVGRVGCFPALGPIEAEDPDEPVLGLDDPRTEDGEAEASAEWRDLLSPLVDPGLHGAWLHGVDPELRGHSDHIASASAICTVSSMPAGMPGRTVGAMPEYEDCRAAALAQRPVRIGEIDACSSEPWEDFRRSGQFTPYSALFNVTGQPAISLPLHWSDAGLPIGDRGGVGQLVEERQEVPKHHAKPPQKNTRAHARYLEPHRRDYVAPRTPAQTFNTFIWAIALMLGLSIAGYFIWLLADNMSAKLASQIESRFILG